MTSLAEKLSFIKLEASPYICHRLSSIMYHGPKATQNSKLINVEHCPFHEDCKTKLITLQTTNNKRKLKNPQQKDKSTLLKAS
jgi:hypothetical protein